jgi:hypothetical protein
VKAYLFQKNKNESIGDPSITSKFTYAGCFPMEMINLSRLLELRAERKHIRNQRSNLRICIYHYPGQGTSFA